jgi:hypothetical protein
MRVKTLATLMSIVIAITAFVVVTIALGEDDVAAIVFVASLLSVSVAVGIAISRRMLGERGELTLREQRRRLHDGTLPPIDPRLPRLIRNFGILMVAAMLLAIPTLWIELGATWGIVVAVLTAWGTFSTWRVYSITKRQARR